MSTIGWFDCLKTPYESGQLIDYGMKGAFYRQNTEMKSTDEEYRKECFGLCYFSSGGFIALKLSNWGRLFV